MARYGRSQPPRVISVRNPLVPPAPFLIPAAKVHVISSAAWRSRRPATSIKQVRNTLVPAVILTSAPKIHIVSPATWRSYRPVVSIKQVRNQLVSLVTLPSTPKVYVISLGRRRQIPVLIKVLRGPPALITIPQLAPQIHVNLAGTRRMMSPAFIKFLRTQLAASSPVVSPVALWINTWP